MDGWVVWLVGWVGGEMKIKANLSQSLVEVEAELGNIQDTDHCKRMVSGNIIKCSKADEKGLDERIIRENKMLIRLVKKKKKIGKKQSSKKNKVKKRKGKKRKTERKRKGAKYQRTVELIN